MLGGIAFLAGLMYLHVNGMPLTISGMIELSGAGTAQSALLVMPVILLSILFSKQLKQSIVASGVKG